MTSGGMVGWVPPEGRRSTSDIIWTCLSVFLICSWRCIHLNLPTEAESRGESHQFRLGSCTLPYWPRRPLWTKWLRKITWMAIICIAPEFGVAMSVKQWLEARETLCKINGKYPARFTLAHAFFANMGGIVLRTAEPESGVASGETVTLERVALLESNHKGSGPPGPPKFRDVVIGLGKSTDLATDHEPFMKQADSLVFAEGLAAVYPDIANAPTEADIFDKSHSDAITKIFAIAQSVWLILQCISRLAQGQAITQLELSTMAFIVCALGMYCFWWNKPFNVERRHVAVYLPRPNETNDLRDFKICNSNGRVSNIETIPGSSMSMPVVLMATTLGPERKVSAEEIRVCAAIYIPGALFSTIHLAAWNWTFPSAIAQTIWRVSAAVALGTTFTPMFTAILLWTIPWFNRWEGVVFWFPLLGGLTLSMMLFVGYIVSRGCLLFLTFYCLSSMPASAYERVGWTGLIPHFG